MNTSILAKITLTNEYIEELFVVNTDDFFTACEIVKAELAKYNDDVKSIMCFNASKLLVRNLPSNTRAVRSIAA
jgi:hypothetical protein